MTAWIRIAIVAAAFAAGFAVNGWRKGMEIAEMKADASAAQVQAVNTARAEEQAKTQKLMEAVNASKQRETTLRADADRTRAAADRLRDELRQTRANLPHLAESACRVRADALADVLGSCVNEYRGLAEKADRHASDAKTLIDAWPK